MMPAVRIEHGFEAIGERAWEGLVSRASKATLYQGWAWQHAWWQAFRTHGGRVRELMLVCVYEGDLLTALAPLMRYTERGRQVLQFVGAGTGVALQADILYADGADDARASILAHVQQQPDLWDAWLYDCVSEHSTTPAAVQRWSSAAAYEFETRTPDKACASSLLNREQLAAVASSPGAARATADARCVATHLQQADEITEALRVMCGLHIHGPYTREQPSRYVEQPFRTFLRAQLVHAVAHGQCVAVSLASEGTPVAVYLGVVMNNTLHTLDFAVDPAHQHGSLARALLHEVLNVAATGGTQHVQLPSTLGTLVPEATGQPLITTSFRVGRTGQPAGGSAGRGGSSLKTVVTEVVELAGIARNATKIIADLKAKASATASHRDFYDDATVMKQYVRKPLLLKPEYTVWHEMRSALRTMRVLDIAVGAGRTTPYFGTMVRDYLAYDYAEKMVEECQRLVGDLVSPARITCDDARAMATVPDASQDFVFISYNGIDTVGGESERLKVLREVRRVAAPGAYFFFSSHNLRSLTPYGSGDSTLRGNSSPLGNRFKRVRRYLLMRAANPGMRTLRRQPNAMIYDVGGEYQYPHYYIAPSAQIRQLTDHQFSHVRVFSGNTGLEVHDVRELDRLTDSWLYYLCRV